MESLLGGTGLIDLGCDSLYILFCLTALGPFLFSYNLNNQFTGISELGRNGINTVVKIKGVMAE